MNINYGIMQGRLLPAYKGFYQAHPIDNWEREFSLCKDNKINAIEFIFDEHLYASNPIFNGLDSIIDKVSKFNVEVNSICADYFMKNPIQDATEKELYYYHKILERLIINLSKLKGKVIVLPFVDNSSLKSTNHLIKVSNFLNNLSKICNEKSISLALETDLEPNEFIDFIKNYCDAHISINYDSGNSASLGFNIIDELDIYGNLISDIHIKDRKIGGGPVMLGQGNANLKFLKDYILDSNYNGLITFQAFRDSNPIETFKKQFDYFLNI